MPFRLIFKESRNRNIAGLQNRSGTRKKNGHHITAVSRNGEARDLSEFGKVIN
jgi:hypothetical protein